MVLPDIQYLHYKLKSLINHSILVSLISGDPCSYKFGEESRLTRPRGTACGTY
jgi:hypothetical protein